MNVHNLGNVIAFKFINFDLANLSIKWPLMYLTFILIFSIIELTPSHLSVKSTVLGDD